MSEMYELYRCKYKGEILYIGQGLRGRHKHCNSGCSHVYELNRIHFTEGSDALDIEVISEFKVKGESLLLEKEYIKKFKPKLNTVHTSSDRKLEAMRAAKDFKKGMLTYADKVELKGSAKNKYLLLVGEFCDYYGISNILTEDFVILGDKYYREIGKNHICNLSRFLREKNKGRHGVNNYNQVFCDYIKLSKKIDIQKRLN